MVRPILAKRIMRQRAVLRPRVANAICDPLSNLIRDPANEPVPANVSGCGNSPAFILT